MADDFILASAKQCINGGIVAESSELPAPMLIVGTSIIGARSQARCADCGGHRWACATSCCSRGGDARRRVVELVSPHDAPSLPHSICTP
eukprot:scaffold392_cov101-Isochrysis_galbana.AAC.10